MGCGCEEGGGGAICCGVVGAACCRMPEAEPEEFILSGVPARSFGIPNDDMTFSSVALCDDKGSNSLLCTDV